MIQRAVSACASGLAGLGDVVKLMVYVDHASGCAHLALRRRAFRYTADVSSARSLIWTWIASLLLCTSAMAPTRGNRNMRAAKRYARPTSGWAGRATPGGCTVFAESIFRRTACRCQTTDGWPEDHNDRSAQMDAHQRRVARCFVEVGLLQKCDDLVQDDRATARQMCIRFRARTLSACTLEIQCLTSHDARQCMNRNCT